MMQKTQGYSMKDLIQFSSSHDLPNIAAMSELEHRCDFHHKIYNLYLTSRGM